VKQKRKEFWRRHKPQKEFDITLLMPAHMLKGKRFETPRDVNKESRRSQRLLRGTQEATILASCRRGPSCDQTFCPICAREFRRWFIGELLRTTEHRTRIRVLTILLQSADRKEISNLDFWRHKHALRKRLERAGLNNAIVVGGVEVVYRAKDHRWILHVNLIIVGGRRAAISRFEETFANSDIERPVHTVRLKDRPEQLSYALKFVTYHRPYTQRGPAKSRALPLNGPEHRALVTWMHQRRFADFLFLYNARRKGNMITVVAWPRRRLQG
jgi:hypothetical protein